MTVVHALALGTLLLLSGCTVWLSPERYQDALTDSLAAHNYRAALELVASTPPDDPRRALPEADVEQIMEAAASWRQQTLAEADELAASGRWREGASLLAQADLYLPDELGVAEERIAYAERQHQVAQRHLLDYAFSRAQHLATEGPALQLAQQAAVAPGTLDATAERQAADREQVLALLIPAADSAVDDRQWRIAADFLSAALALEPVPSDRLKQQLKRARDQLADVHVRKRQRRAEAQRQLADEAVEQARAAKAAGDFQRARDILREARAMAGDTRNLDAEQQALDNAIRDFVAARLTEGDRLYAGGKIEAALQQWRQAEKLQPDSSEIIERVHRAERFIERYRALKRD